MNIFFSLIVPVYNVEQYIEKCLLSCIRQDNFHPSNYEVIVVNDGSPDNSEKIITKMIEKYSQHNIKLINRTNGGLSAARNTGLVHAIGKYVWFIDSDDWIAPESLYCLHEKIRAHDDLEILTFKHRTVFPNGLMSNESEVQNYECSGFEYLDRNSFLSAWSSIYSLNLLNKNNLTFKDGIIWEDSEFNLRVNGLSTKNYFYSKTLYYYLRRENSITTEENSFNMVNSRFILIDSVFEFYQKREITKQHLEIIYRHLAKTIIFAIAGFRSLTKESRKILEDKISNNKKYYYSFFHHSGDISLKIKGAFVIYGLKLSQYILNFLVKRAIKRGEGLI